VDEVNDNGPGLSRLAEPDYDGTDRLQRQWKEASGTRSGDSTQLRHLAKVNSVVSDRSRKAQVNILIVSRMTSNNRLTEVAHGTLAFGRATHLPLAAATTEASAEEEDSKRAVILHSF
jgi:hypothetical protein